MLSLFFRFELGKLVKYFETKTLAKIITSLLFLVVFTFVGLGIYGFFVSGFRLINIEAEEDIRMALMLFLYEAFFIVLSGVILVSSLLSSLFNLFRGGYNDWIITSPSFSLFPKIVFLRSIQTSLLPMAVLFIPTILAFNKMYSVGILAFAALFISAFLLLVFISGTTLTLVVLVASFYKRLTKIFRRSFLGFKTLVVTLVAILFSFALVAWRSLTNLDLVRVFRAENVDSDISIATISAYFDHLPTHPFALQMVYWKGQMVSEAMLQLGALFILALLSTLLWWFIAPRFYPLWLTLQEGDMSLRVRNAGQSTFRYIFSGNQLMVLFKKELLVSSRNLRGILWFLFLFLIWILQIGTSVLLDNNVRRHEADISTKVALAQAIQFVIAIYFIASFALRFAFPSFSVEKKTSWILHTAPISFRKIFYGKYAFYVVVFSVLGSIMSTISTEALGMSPMLAFYSSLLLTTVILFVVTLAISLGALFPNTETDDPEVITTSMPGLFFTALALLYGTLSGWILYMTVLDLTPLTLPLFVLITCLMSVLLLVATPKLARK